MICQICDNKMLEGKWNVDKKQFTEVQGNNTWRCPNCEHIFVNYEESGLEFHKNEWRKKHGGRGGIKFDKEFHKLRSVINKKRCNVMIKHLKDLKECDSLLDMGSGGGSFLLKLKDLNLFKKIEAQEISVDCINYLKELKFKTYEGDFSKIIFPHKYDVLTSWHVMEHVKNVKTLAKKMSEITKKYLIVEVPVAKRGNGGYDRNPKKTFNGHFHFFTEKSMTLLFKDYFDDYQVHEAIQKPSLQIIFKK